MEYQPKMDKSHERIFHPTPKIHRQSLFGEAEAAASPLYVLRGKKVTLKMIARA